MMFSKACEYGIRATLFIATKSMNGERVSLKEIARKIDSPEAFTAKILQQLARDGVVESMKGPTGGFKVDPERMEEIKLKDIVSSIDGDAIFSGCGLGLKKCNADKPCPVHHKFKVIRDGLEQMLTTTSLAVLSTELEEGLTFLKH